MAVRAGDRPKVSARGGFRAVVRDLRARFAGTTSLERWGYLIWGLCALVIIVPEVTAAAHANNRWPTISATIGHLEYRWSWVALLVVAVIVGVGFHFLGYPVVDTTAKKLDSNRADLHRPALGRTDQGRLTMRPQESSRLGRGYKVLWLPAGALAVVVGSLLTLGIDPSNKFMLGYVMYGLIGVFFVLVPSVLAFFFSKDVPYPTFFRTIDDLQKRLHFAAVLIVIGLVILLIHLALYPWPGVFHQLKPPDPTSV
jgi:hypothetical protein